MIISDGNKKESYEKQENSSHVGMYVCVKAK